MIPKDRKWAGQFLGNYLGNLWQTFNIDLEKTPNRLSLSGKMRRFASGLGVVHKFLRTDATTTDQWWGLVRASTPSGTDGDMLRNGNTTIYSGTWITDDTAGGGDTSPNNVHDMVIHENANGEQRLIVSTATDLAILNSSGAANVWDINWGSTVASGGIALQNTVYHPLARLQRLVAVGDKISGVPVIHTVDKTDVFSTSRLTFDAVYTVYHILATSTRFWIALQHIKGGNAKIIEWDGSSLAYNNEYELDGGSIPLTGFIKGSDPYFITERGLIFKYTGSGFAVVQDFGLGEDRAIFEHSGADSSVGASLCPYGVIVDGDVVYLNISAPVVSSFSATVMPNGVRRLRAGIYVFNTANRNLYHHMGIGEHASAGTDVNYGGFMGKAGALELTGSDYLIASASVYIGGATWVTSQQNGIYLKIPNGEQASNAGRNRGYFITPQISMKEIEGMWEALFLKFRRFVNSNNRIVVKWRVTEPLFNASAADQAGNALLLMNAPATWASTTTFTCKVPTGVAVGDEVEILSGDNAGCSFAISALSGTPDNSTSLTVTIAEAAPTSSTDTILVRFDNWKTETAISATDIGSKKVPFTAPAHGEFIQFKIELRGFDVQVDELIPAVKSNTQVSQA